MKESIFSTLWPEMDDSWLGSMCTEAVVHVAQLAQSSGITEGISLIHDHKLFQVVHRYKSILLLVFFGVVVLPRLLGLIVSLVARTVRRWSGITLSVKTASPVHGVEGVKATLREQDGMQLSIDIDYVALKPRIFAHDFRNSGRKLFVLQVAKPNLKVLAGKESLQSFQGRGVAAQKEQNIANSTSGTVQLSLLQRISRFAKGVTGLMLTSLIEVVVTDAAAHVQLPHDVCFRVSFDLVIVSLFLSSRKLGATRVEAIIQMMYAELIKSNGESQQSPFPKRRAGQLIEKDMSDKLTRFQPKHVEGLAPRREDYDDKTEASIHPTAQNADATVSDAFPYADLQQVLVKHTAGAFCEEIPACFSVSRVDFTASANLNRNAAIKDITHLGIHFQPIFASLSISHLPTVAPNVAKLAKIFPSTPPRSVADLAVSDADPDAAVKQAIRLQQQLRRRMQISVSYVGMCAVVPVQNENPVSGPSSSNSNQAEVPLEATWIDCEQAVYRSLGFSDARLSAECRPSAGIKFSAETSRDTDKNGSVDCATLSISQIGLSLAASANQFLCVRDINCRLNITGIPPEYSRDVLQSTNSSDGSEVDEEDAAEAIPSNASPTHPSNAAFSSLKNAHFRRRHLSDHNSKPSSAIRPFAFMSSHDECNANHVTISLQVSIVGIDVDASPEHIISSLIFGSWITAIHKSLNFDQSRGSQATVVSSSGGLAASSPAVMDFSVASSIQRMESRFICWPSSGTISEEQGTVIVMHASGIELFAGQDDSTGTDEHTKSCKVVHFKIYCEPLEKSSGFAFPPKVGNACTIEHSNYIFAASNLRFRSELLLSGMAAGNRKSSSLQGSSEIGLGSSVTIDAPKCAIFISVPLLMQLLTAGEACAREIHDVLQHSLTSSPIYQKGSTGLDSVNEGRKHFSLSPTSDEGSSPWQPWNTGSGGVKQVPTNRQIRAQIGVVVLSAVCSLGTNGFAFISHSLSGTNLAFKHSILSLKTQSASVSVNAKLLKDQPSLVLCLPEAIKTIMRPGKEYTSLQNPTSRPQKSGGLRGSVSAHLRRQKSSTNSTTTSIIRIDDCAVPMVSFGSLDATISMEHKQVACGLQSCRGSLESPCFAVVGAFTSAQSEAASVFADLSFAVESIKRGFLDSQPKLPGFIHGFEEDFAQKPTVITPSDGTAAHQNLENLTERFHGRTQQYAEHFGNSQTLNPPSVFQRQGSLLSEVSLDSPPAKLAGDSVRKADSIEWLACITMFDTKVSVCTESGVLSGTLKEIHICQFSRDSTPPSILRPFPIDEWASSLETHNAPTSGGMSIVLDALSIGIRNTPDANFLHVSRASISIPSTPSFDLISLDDLKKSQSKSGHASSSPETLGSIFSESTFPIGPPGSGNISSSDLTIVHGLPSMGHAGQIAVCVGKIQINLSQPNGISLHSRINSCMTEWIEIGRVLDETICLVKAGSKHLKDSKFSSSSESRIQPAEIPIQMPKSRRAVTAAINGFELNISDSCMNAFLAKRSELAHSESVQQSEREAELEARLKSRHAQRLSNTDVANLKDAVLRQHASIWKHRWTSIDYRTPPLFSISFRNLLFSAVDTPNNLLFKDIQVLDESGATRESPEWPKFDTMIGGPLCMDIVDFQLSLRDYVEPIVSIPKISVSGRAAFAEEVAPPPLIQSKSVSLLKPVCHKIAPSGGDRVSDNRQQVPNPSIHYNIHKPEHSMEIHSHSIELQKGCCPPKLYLQLEATSDNALVSFHPSFSAALSEASAVLSTVSTPSGSPYPPLPSWDKMRQMFHGKFHLTCTNSRARLHNSTNPSQRSNFFDLSSAVTEISWSNGTIAIEGDTVEGDVDFSDGTRWPLLSSTSCGLKVSLTWDCLGTSTAHHATQIMSQLDTGQFQEEMDLINDFWLPYRSQGLEITVKGRLVSPVIRLHPRVVSFFSGVQEHFEQESLPAHFYIPIPSGDTHQPAFRLLPDSKAGVASHITAVMTECVLKHPAVYGMFTCALPPREAWNEDFKAQSVKHLHQQPGLAVFYNRYTAVKLQTLHIEQPVPKFSQRRCIQLASDLHQLEDDDRILVKKCWLNSWLGFDSEYFVMGICSGSSFECAGWRCSRGSLIQKKSQCPSFDNMQDVVDFMNMQSRPMATASSLKLRVGKNRSPNFEGIPDDKSIISARSMRSTYRQSLPSSNEGAAGLTSRNVEKLTSQQLSQLNMSEFLGDVNGSGQGGNDRIKNWVSSIHAEQRPDINETPDSRSHRDNFTDVESTDGRSTRMSDAGSTYGTVPDISGLTLDVYTDDLFVEITPENRLAYSSWFDSLKLCLRKPAPTYISSQRDMVNQRQRHSARSDNDEDRFNFPPCLDESQRQSWSKKNSQWEKVFMRIRCKMPQVALTAAPPENVSKRGRILLTAASGKLTDKGVIYFLASQASWGHIRRHISLNMQGLQVWNDTSPQNIVAKHRHQVSSTGVHLDTTSQLLGSIWGRFLWITGDANLRNQLQRVIQPTSLFYRYSFDDETVETQDKDASSASSSIVTDGSGGFDTEEGMAVRVEVSSIQATTSSSVFYDVFGVVRGMLHPLPDDEKQDSESQKIKFVSQLAPGRQASLQTAEAAVIRLKKSLKNCTTDSLSRANLEQQLSAAKSQLNQLLAMSQQDSERMKMRLVTYKVGGGAWKLELPRKITELARGVLPQDISGVEGDLEFAEIRLDLLRGSVLYDQGEPKEYLFSLRSLWVLDEFTRRLGSHAVRPQSKNLHSFHSKDDDELGAHGPGGQAVATSQGGHSIGGHRTKRRVSAALGSPLSPSGEQLLRILARKGPQVGGISVFEQFTMTFLPLRIDITHEFYRCLMKFFFPDPSQAHIQNAVEERVAQNFRDSQGGSGMTLERTESNASVNSIALSPDHRASPIDSTPVPSGNLDSPEIAPRLNQRRGAALRQEMQNNEEERTGDLGVDVARDLESMRSRAQNNARFEFIGVSELQLMISYKGLRDWNFRDIEELEIAIPRIHIENETYSWQELFGEIRHQVLFNLLPQLGNVAKHKIRSIFSRKKQVSKSDDSSNLQTPARLPGPSVLDDDDDEFDSVSEHKAGIGQPAPENMALEEDIEQTLSGSRMSIGMGAPLDRSRSYGLTRKTAFFRK